jgi:hypothetical protein
MRIQPCHIAGKDNVEADALSCFTNGQLTSWVNVIVICSPLKTCKICLLPPDLLATLAALSSCQLTEDTYDELMTALMTLELDFLPNGSNLKVIQELYISMVGHGKKN